MEFITNLFRGKKKSYLFGTYLLFWCIFHWQGLYVSIFVNEDKIYSKFHLLKNEYVDKYFFSMHFDSWRFYVADIAPLILAVAFLWLVPKYLLIHLYRKEQDNRAAKEMVILDVEQEIEKKKKSVATETTEKIDAQIALAEKRKDAARIDPKILWQAELDEFKKDPAYSSFGTIISAYYDHRGKITDYTGGNNFKVSSGALILAENRGLIELDINANHLNLTEKGKWFAERNEMFAR